MLQFLRRKAGTSQETYFVIFITYLKYSSIISLCEEPNFLKPLYTKVCYFTEKEIFSIILARCTVYQLCTVLLHAVRSSSPASVWSKFACSNICVNRACGFGHGRCQKYPFAGGGERNSICICAQGSFAESALWAVELWPLVLKAESK